MSSRIHLMIRTIGAIAVAGAGILSGSCTSTITDSKSNSLLVIDRLTGVAGGVAEEETTLQSDVVTTEGGVFEDVGQVVFRLLLKDPGSPTVPNVATTNNFITVNRYRVEYTRADGQNRPGIDVPFAWDGAFTVTVRAEGSAAASFVLVRIQAKREPPLTSLWQCGGSCAITMIAKVTFFGHDQTGRAVQASGNIQIDFANWADE